MVTVNIKFVELFDSFQNRESADSLRLLLDELTAHSVAALRRRRGVSRHWFRDYIAHDELNQSARRAEADLIVGVQVVREQLCDLSAIEPRRRNVRALLKRLVVHQNH